MPSTAHPPRPRRRPRLTLAATVLAALAALAALPAADAHAAGGTFRQILCSSPDTDGAVNETGITDGLSAFGTASAWMPDLAAPATCAADGPMDSQRAITLGPSTNAAVPANAWAALRYELTEPGLTLAHGRLYRALKESASPDDVTVIQHAGDAPDNPRGTPYNGWDVWPARSTTSNHPGDLTQAWDARNDVPLTVAGNAFTITARCEPDTGVTSTCADTAGRWRYVMFGAELTIRDDADPQVANVSGALTAGDATDGELSFDATDVGGGVYRTTVLVGNEVVHEQVADPESTRCRDLEPYDADDRQFAYQRPCPPEARVSLDWDTSALREGEHDIRVFVEDAAGNETPVVDRRATVDRFPAPQPVPGAPPQVGGDAVLGETLAPLPGSWTNASWFDLRWERCNADATQCVFLPWAPPIAYTTTEDDLGTRLRIVVRAVNEAGESATLASEPSPVVTRAAAASPTNPTPPGGTTPAPTDPTPGAPGAAGTAGRDGVAGPQGTDGVNGTGASHRARITLTAGRRTRVRRGFAARTPLTGRLTDGGRPPDRRRARPARRAPRRDRRARALRRRGEHRRRRALPLHRRARALAHDRRPVLRVRRRHRRDRQRPRPSGRAGRGHPARPPGAARPDDVADRSPAPPAAQRRRAQDPGARRPALRTFDTTRTRRGGRYRFGYRFKAAAAGRRFALRVLVSTPTYPFAQGASPARRIRVPR